MRLLTGKLFILAFSLAACTGEKSDSAAADNDQLVQGGRIAGVQTYTPSKQKTADGTYDPGADASIALWRSLITLPDGWIDASASLSMALIPGGIVASNDLAPLSPMMSFKATLEDGSAVPRATLRHSLTVATIVDRKIDPDTTIALIVLNQGAEDEQGYALPSSELSFTTQADGSTNVSFTTRDTAFAFAIAASTKGLTPAGFAAYPSVPPDNSSFAATSTGVSDEPAEAKLSWTPAEGSRKAYRLSVSYADTYPPAGCTDGAVLDSASITSERLTFPIRSSTDRYIAPALTDGALAKFRLCSLNGRTPPDASDGVTIEWQLPARVRVALSGTPAAHSNVAALAVAVSADGLTDYQYALAASETDCASATYSAWIAAGTPISDTISDGDKTLCVLGRKGTSNVQVIATMHSWNQDLTPPAAFSLATITTPSQTTAPAISWSVASGASTYHMIVASDASCASPVQEGDVTTELFQTTALADGTYYACVVAADLAGNQTPASNTALPFVVDTTPPVFTALPLLPDAADGWINAAEHAVAQDLAGPLSGSAYTGAAYALTTAATSCDAALTYGVMPQQNDAGLGSDAAYKICARLVDAAANTTYGASSTFQRKVTAPLFVLAALANDAADNYINATEHGGTLDLASAAAGTSFDTAAYVLVAAATTCDNSLTYGSVPKENSATLTSDGSYKVCVKLSDTAANPPAFGESAPFDFDATPPTFTSIDFQNGAADGYVNIADHASSAAVGGALVAAGHATAAYALVTNATACTPSVVYGSMPLLNSTVFSGDGLYKICVKLSDTAGNNAYFASAGTVALDLTAPSFIGVALAGDALDTYLNATERGDATAIVAAATGAGFDSVGYAVVSAATTCDNSLTYGSIPLANDAGLSGDASYKVCVQMQDAAGNNAAYGSSSSVTVDTTPPVLNSVSATNGDGSYRDADVIGITLTYNEAVTVAGGTPTLLLETGATDASASYTSGTGTTSLTFNYTVQAADSSADLTTNAVPPQLALNAATITDAAGNSAALDVGAATSLATNKNIVIDNDPPSVFALVTPTSASTITDNTPTATWSDPGDATSFDVKVDDTSGCVSPLQSYSAVAGTSQAITTLANGVYYICVTARDNAGNTTAASNDNLTFTVSTGVWTTLASGSAPTDRRGARAVYNTVAGRVLIWGGEGAGPTYLNTGAALDPATNNWTPIDASDGDKPSGRIDFTATWTGTKMLIWGGYDGTSVVNSGALYLPVGDSWDPIAAGSAPTARRAHSAVWDSVNARVIIFGGNNGAAAVDTGAAYDPAGNSWTTLDISEGDHAAAREQHTAVWAGSKMLVWGGIDAGTALNSGAIYDPAGGAGTIWTPITTTGAPAARHGHVAFWDETSLRMIIFGGHAQGGAALNDGGIYDPALDSWTALAAADAPSARFAAAAVWDNGGQRLLIFGGDSGSAAIASGAALQMPGNLWSIPALSSSGAPSARYDAAAVWTGTKMVVFGGFDGTGMAAGGAMLTPP